MRTIAPIAVISIVVRSTTKLCLAVTMIATVGIPAVAAQPAAASRPPTDAERASIAALLNLTPECAAALISTVDPTWAEAHSTNAAGCQQGNGFVLLRLGEPGWYVDYESSGDTCPLKGIHTSVSADLGLCKPISVFPYLPYFSRSYPTDVRLGVKPKAMLPLVGASGIYRNIHWSSWGSSSAVGRGVYFYQFMGERAKIPFQIKLFGARTCPNGIRLFTRRKIRATHASQASWLRRDANRTRFGSCEENETSPIT